MSGADVVIVKDAQVITPGSNEERALEVQERIEGLRHNLLEGMFDLAELLAETRRNEYYRVWGYTNFGQWVEEGSGLDMSERTAFYLINIIEGAKELGIPREQLLVARISKLKDIFSLDRKKHGDKIRALVEKAGDCDLNDIREEVHRIKSGDEALEPYVFITLKIPKSVKEHTVDSAFEIVRRQNGNVQNEQGEVIELSDGKCLEYVCQAYLQDPNNKLEGD